MKLFIKFLILFIPTFSFGQLNISSIDSLAQIQVNKYLSDGETKYVLLYEYGCIGCEVDSNCSCEFGDTEIYIITDSNKICKFNCCEKICGELNSDINLLLKDQQITENHFKNTLKYDYLESHSDFYRIELITIDTVLSVQFPTFLFNEDYEFKNHNLNQKSKIMVDKLVEITTKEGIIK